MDAIDALEQEHYESAGEALALLAEAAREADGERDRDRLTRMLDRLYEATRRVAERFKARGFSVTVGLPMGVSVSVDWETRQHGR